MCIHFKDSIEKYELKIFKLLHLEILLPKYTNAYMHIFSARNSDFSFITIAII